MRGHRAPRGRALGVRNRHFRAKELTAQPTRMRPGVAPLHLPGQMQAEGISALGPADLVVVIGLRQHPTGFARRIEARRDRLGELEQISEVLGFAVQGPARPGTRIRPASGPGRVRGAS